LAILRTG